MMSAFNTSSTDNIDLMTPEIHSLMNHLVDADIDNINFTSFDTLVCTTLSVSVCLSVCVGSVTGHNIVVLLSLLQHHVRLLMVDKTLVNS